MWKTVSIKFSALIRSVHCFAYAYARRTILKKIIDFVVYFDSHVDEDVLLDQNGEKLSYLVLVPNSIEIG
jgi:hypothetical protein